MDRRRPRRHTLVLAGEAPAVHEGPMLILAQMLVYALALAGIVAGSLGMLFFAGGALSGARPRAVRVRNGVFAVLCLAAIVASAAAGFVGVPALLYFAAQ